MSVIVRLVILETNAHTKTTALLSHVATEAVASPTTAPQPATLAHVLPASPAPGALRTSSNAPAGQALAITAGASTPTARIPVSASQGILEGTVMRSMFRVSRRHVNMMGDARLWIS